MGDARGTPPLLLLHGWFASGGLNWLGSFAALADRYRILAPDFRGHARGGASPSGFTIEDCADDMAALLATLCPEEPAVVVGYSMGGMVAQELWRRHPSRVAGLVLGATSAAPVPASRGRRVFSESMRLAHRLSRPFGPASEDRPESDVANRGDKRSTTHAWALREIGRHHWPTVFDAGRAIAEFDTRSWIASVDVPTRVLLTKRDTLVPPEQQHEMARSIPGARIESIDAGHFACVRDDFAPLLLRSVRAVERGMG